VTTVVISQPMYFPWIGFFAQMAMADVYVWLDDVQFSRGSFTNRIQVKTIKGYHWMTIPLAGKGSFQKISDLQASKDDWRASHRDLLRQQLSELPYRSEALSVFDAGVACDTVSNCLIASCVRPAVHIGVLPPKIFRSSDFKSVGSSWQRVLDIVLELGGTRYLTGHGAANYLDHEEFEKNDIAVEYMKYDPLPWRQNFDSPFTPYVTILDPIAALGAEVNSHLRPQTMPWREFLGLRKK
jgi:hypothetical protein